MGVLVSAMFLLSYSDVTMLSSHVVPHLSFVISHLVRKTTFHALQGHNTTELKTFSGVFPKWVELSLNSANLRNLMKHWSMNWAQFKDPVSHMCIAGTVVACWFITQEVWILLFCKDIFYTICIFFRINLGKIRITEHYDVIWPCSARSHIRLCLQWQHASNSCYFPGVCHQSGHR